ncbi:MAG: hypothetical protein QM667_09555 [Asticcacaulis sp.]
MRRTAFALFLIALFALVCAPDIARRLVAIDAPWLGWVQLGVLIVGTVFAARLRLRDAGRPAYWLSQALLVVLPIYALFASPLAGFLPVPSQLSTLALIGANGVVFGGLIFLVLTPSLILPVVEPRETRTEPPGQADTSSTTTDTTSAPGPTSDKAMSEDTNPDSRPDSASDGNSGDSGSADSSASDGGGGDGGGGGD